MTLRYYPDQALRQRSVTVSVDEACDYLNLIKYMSKLMVDSGGIGLAAPQVGINKRLIVVLQGDKVVSMINPVCLESSTELWRHQEGCLSIPGFFGEVNRSKSIKVRYSVDGMSPGIVGEFSGIDASCILHEIDHLDGILFTDRLGIGDSMKFKKWIKSRRIAKT